jgi:chromosome segregation ATPase
MSIEEEIDRSEELRDELKEDKLENLNLNETNNEIQQLKQIIDEKSKEICNLETKLDDIDRQSKENIEKLHEDFKLKLDEAFKKFQDSQKDKSSLVMKYADAERRCIDLNRTIDLLQTKLTDASKDKFKLEETIGKIRIEKNKLNDELELKLIEIKQLLIKIDKLKEDFVLVDAKNNVSQLKLKQEIEKTVQLKEEIERLKKIECEIELNLNSDANRSKDLLEENVKLNEERINLSAILQDQKDMNKNLLTEVLRLKEHQMTLNKEIEEKNFLLEKIEMLNGELNEAQMELNDLRKKQNELLELTSKLTEKNIQLQSENSKLKDQV